MRRKLPLVVLLSLSTASPLSLALGLGEARVQSSLNAPLRATIPLTDTRGIDARAMRVMPGDVTAFERAGLTRDRRVGDIEYAIEQEQGELVLTLRSDHAIREPYLDLLLRVEWPEGRQHHQVTLLFDPPDYADMPALITATTSERSPQRDEASRDEARVEERRASTASDPTEKDSRWISSGDTLWSVASRLRPDDTISMHQMMLALVEANPEAFPSGNINDMRAGLALSVPSREAIARRSRDEADRQVIAQNQAWSTRDSGTAMADIARTSSVDASAAPTSTERRGAARQDARATNAAYTDPGGAQRLTLLSDAELAAEGNMTVPLDGGQRLVTAHVTELAAAPANGTGDKQDGADGAGADDERGQQDEARLLRLESQLLASQQALQEVQEERDALQEELGQLRDEFAALRDQLSELTAGREGVDGAGAGGIAEPQQASSDTAAPNSIHWWGALWQGMRDNTVALGGVAVALLLALLVLRRRRHEHDDGPTFAQAYGVGATVVATPRQDSSTSGHQAATYQASTQSPSHAPAQAEAPEAPVRASMPEAEVISEADIFIAYGRFDQARDILEASLENEPAREDLRLKLLKVQVERQDWNAAEREAQRLMDSDDSTVQEEAERLLARRGDNASAAEKDVAERDAPELLVMPEWHQSAAEQAPASVPESPAPRSEAAESGMEEAVQETLPQEPDPTPVARPVSNVIDYRPPSLDPEPAPRSDELQQPSIEFAPATRPDETEYDDMSGLSAPHSERQSAAGELDESQWEIEEVAFEPLHLDNKGPAAASPEASLRLVVLARQLLDAGEHDQAHELLRQVMAHGEATLQEEARDLIAQHNLD